MKNSGETKKVLKKMEDRRTGNAVEKLGHEGGAEEKPKDSLKAGTERSPAMDDIKKESSHVDPGSFLKHPRVKAIKQKKLVNDTAYFLHHPQIKPHGPSMPPKKPKE